MPKQQSFAWEVGLLWKDEIDKEEFESLAFFISVKSLNYKYVNAWLPSRTIINIFESILHVYIAQ